ESTTSKQIQLFEVQTYSSGVNVSLDGSATQSSTLKDHIRFQASNVIDGNNSTFCHTNDKNVWLEVVLKDPADIESIVIFNRWCVDPLDPSACLCRLSYSTLKLYSEHGSLVSAQTIGDTCGSPIVSQQFTTCSSSTALPSKYPLIQPTLHPTSSPSNFPSLDQTPPPTSSPTRKPSQIPTASPSTTPSFAPTSNPSKSPSKSPSLNPTISPTLRPTTKPSIIPTASPTSSPSLMPTHYPSKSPLNSPSFSPTSSPTKFPTVSPSASPTHRTKKYSFKYLGLGDCLDSFSNKYSSVRLENLPENTPAMDCHDWCNQYPDQALVGVTIEKLLGFTNCACLFSGEVPSYIDHTKYSPVAAEPQPWHNFNGIGPVERTSLSPHYFECYYSYDPIPTSSPTVSFPPTVSLSPSSSISPTRGPMDVPKYYYVGVGECVDSVGHYYDSIPGPFVNSTQSCFDWCNQNPDPGLMGVMLYTNPVGFWCQCLFSDGVSSQIDLTLYDPPGGPPITFPNGIGLVYKSDGWNDQAECYAAIFPGPPTDQPMYYLVGMGWCLDSLGKMYDNRVDSPFVPSVTDDSFCHDWCNQNPDPDLVGLEVHIFSVGIQCKCLYLGQSPVSVRKYMYTPPASEITVAPPSAGDIQKTLFYSSIRCYSTSRTFPTKNPSVSPSHSPSKSPTVHPTSFPTTRPTLPPTNFPTTKNPTTHPTNFPTKSPKFSLLGTGACVSSSDSGYNYYEVSKLPEETTDTYCMTWCGQNPHNNLVGLEVRRGFIARPFYVNCFCLFSGKLPIEISANSYNPTASGSYNDSEATGEISKVADAVFWSKCYKWS
ncbi:hypothetical protein ACHAW6_012504, partial [Cyclotella cf. meneghiniana]